MTSDPTIRTVLGIPEPTWKPGDRNPAYFGGFRNAEDERDFADFERRQWEHDQATEAKAVA